MAYLFDLNKQKNFETNERKTSLDHGKRTSQMGGINFHPWVNLQTQNPLNKGSPEEGS